MKSIDRNAVLGLLGPRPMHFMEICDRLSVPRKEKDALLALLETLRNEDLAQELPGKRFRAAKKKPVPVQAGAVPETNANEATGRITVHARGFGFLAADDGLGDVFIAPDSVGGALHGDRVRARVEKGSRGREGRVLEVLDRARDKLTGIVRRDGRQFVFLPDDPRMRSPLPIEGKVPPQADGGTTVIARIVSFPRTSRDVPEVAIAEVLGKAGLAAVEVAKLKIRDGVIEPFPAEVLEEARQVPTSVLPEDIAEREDLRHIEFVTIDPPDARDHDDAVWVERLAHGRFRVLVAIADVSHYVRKDTAIDREALARGCTIYLPDRAIPMLPKEISSGMASLVPDVDRLTLGVEVELSKDGVIETSRYFEGVMRSRARLTYGGVARALGWTTEPPADPKAEARIPLLEALSEVSGLLRKRRRARGSLDFDLPEPRVLLEEATGEPIDVYRSREDPGIRKAYAVIEDFMLLANEVVAEDLHRRGMPALYRVHGKPDPKKLSLFIELAESFGHRLDLETASDPKVLSEFLRDIEGTAQAGPLGHLLLRAMQQAQYDVKNIGHFALAAKDYLHFTSPIRRYPDLCVHRVVRAVIRGEHVDHAKLLTDLKFAGMESSRLERRAMVLERDVVDLYRALLLKDRVGEEFPAHVSSVSEYGIYVSVDSPFADVFIPFERLPGSFEANALNTEASDRFTGLSYALGDAVEVLLETVSIERRESRGIPVEFADADVPFPGDDRRPRPGQRRDGGEPPRRSGSGRRDNRGDGRGDAAGDGRGPRRGPGKGAPGRGPKKGRRGDNRGKASAGGGQGKSQGKPQGGTGGGKSAKPGKRSGGKRGKRGRR